MSKKVVFSSSILVLLITVSAFASSDANCAAQKSQPGFLPLPGDINTDCTVDFKDFALLAQNWLMSGPSLQGDIDKSGTIDYTDLVIFIDKWLQDNSVPQPPLANSMLNVVMAGYQGWFRCPNDGANLGWIHWSYDGGVTFDVEMWPDMNEYVKKYQAGSYTLPDASKAYVYSPMDYQTVFTHFKWMQQYGIDGVWFQRFLVDLPGGPNQNRYAANLQVLNNVQAACYMTDRIWAVSYDTACMPTNSIYSSLTADWESLVAKGILNDPHYLHHNGKPVVSIWGFYTSSGNMTPVVGNQIIDYFKGKDVYLFGGGNWDWVSVTDPQWSAMFRRFDAFGGWNIGNFSIDGEGKKWATTSYWATAKSTAESVNMLFVPVLYAGYSWSKSTPSNFNLLPRMGGKFYWKQWVAATQTGFGTVYLAMFDEVDEGTAIYKVTNSPPTQRNYVTYEGYPSDWYMRLANEGCKMIRGQIPLTTTIPIQP